MISNPRIGQLVQLHYAKKRVPFAPYHGRQGIVVMCGKGRPRNHGVLIDGELVCVPCGQLNRVKESSRHAAARAGRGGMSQPASALETALQALALGLSPVPPVEDEAIAHWPTSRMVPTRTANPALPGNPMERSRRRSVGFTAGLPTDAGASAWRPGYGGVECFEFDSRDAYDAYLEAADEAGLSELVNRIRSGV